MLGDYYTHKRTGKRCRVVTTYACDHRIVEIEYGNGDRVNVMTSSLTAREEIAA